MYLNILKKDLKNRKATNIILLVFIILATMFVASSVNSILSVTTALDDYMEMANVPDLTIITLRDEMLVDINQLLDSTESVNGYEIQKLLYLGQNDVRFNDEKEGRIDEGTIIIHGDENLTVNLFLDDNSILQEVKEGEIYLNGTYAEQYGLKKGDKITINKYGSFEFTFAGTVKDAMFGSSGNSIFRCIINENDFERIYENDLAKELWSGKLIYVETDNPQSVIDEVFPKAGNAVNVAMGREDIKLSYVFDMIVTGIIIVVSVILIAVAFMVLKFSISFTLSEELREIGVMKAIGVSNNRIRGLYIAKYVAMAVVGAMIGFGLSFPFGDLLMSISSKSIILGGTNPAYINVICSIIVVGIITLFCYGCTRKVNTLAPIDAIRNGQTGERFRKKSIMSLSKSKMGATSFLALNDIVSSPKKFVTVTLTFFLCITLMLMLSTTVNTMKDGSLVKCFGTMGGHIGITEKDAIEFLCEGGRELSEARLEEVEKLLEEKGMPADCSKEYIFMFPLEFGEGEKKSQSFGTICYQGIGTTMDEYEYTKGTAPQNTNEVAITKKLAKTLGADIGDTITVKTLNGDKKYIITAFMQIMNGSGQCLRFHTDEDLSFAEVTGNVGSIIVRFKDNPSEKEIERRVDIINNLGLEYGEAEPLKEFAIDAIGVVDTLDTVQNFIIIVTIVLVAMLTILLETSFITKEKKEIALMKATGMTNGKIYAYHTLRFVFVGVVAILLGWILALPMTHLCIDPVFKMMGMELAVNYHINPLEMFLIYPAIVLATTTLSAFLTSLATKSIKSVDTANIE